MKKILFMAMAVVAMAVVACGPKDQIKVVNGADSTALKDSIAKIEAALKAIADSVEKARQDSNLQAKADSAAKATEQNLCLALLKEIHTPRGYDEIFKGRWVKMHCTARMIKILKDEYMYDSEPGADVYGSWIIGGWNPGEEEIESKISAFNALDNGYYEVKFRSVSPYAKGIRTLRYKMLVENSIAKIDDANMTSDYRYQY